MSAISSDQLVWTTSWQQKAACHRIARPERFDVQEPSYALNVIEDFCDHCPVIAACRGWAKTESWWTGVAGGLLWTSTHNRRVHYRPIRMRVHARVESSMHLPMQ